MKDDIILKTVAVVLGKALTSATGAGQTIDILVCLAG